MLVCIILISHGEQMKFLIFFGVNFGIFCKPSINHGSRSVFGCISSLVHSTAWAIPLNLITRTPVGLQAIHSILLSCSVFIFHFYRIQISESIYDTGAHSFSELFPHMKTNNHCDSFLEVEEWNLYFPNISASSILLLWFQNIFESEPYKFNYYR